MSRPQTLKILVGEDHTLYRQALLQMLAMAVADVACREASSLHEVFNLVAQEDFDLILLDADLLPVPDTAISGLSALRNRAPAIPIILLTLDAPLDCVQGALAAGAAGCIPKSLPRPQMAAAVREVLRGGLYIPTDLRAAGRRN